MVGYAQQTLSADNMMKKNWQCDPLCSLCFCQQETAQHLLTQYNYTGALWNQFHAHYGLPDYNTVIAKGWPLDWVRTLISAYGKSELRSKLGLLFTFWWGIRKREESSYFSEF
jgi:hypothetical protein